MNILSICMAMYSSYTSIEPIVQLLRNKIPGSQLITWLTVIGNISLWL